MKKRNTLLAAFLLAFSFSLHAQESAVLWLYYAGGEEITLTIAGRGQSYTEYDFPEGGAALGPGDIVMTGRESSAELQLLFEGGEAPDEYAARAESPGALVKLAEGSTLRFLSFSGGEAVLEILYGRLRAVSAGAPEDGGAALRIKAGNAVMDVSGGDFNVDYMIHPGESLIESGRNGSMRLQVCSFRGSTDIALPGNTSTAVFAVKEYERVAIEAGSTRSVVERRPLDMATISYWEAMPFTAGAPAAAPDTALPGRGSRLAAAGDGGEQYVIFPIIDSESAALAADRRQSAAGGEAAPAPASGERAKLVLKNAFLIAGTVLAGAGLGANLYGLYGGGPAAEIAARYGYIPLGAGLASLIAACIINPRIPR
jgi:hypothetical protein